MKPSNIILEGITGAALHAAECDEEATVSAASPGLAPRRYELDDTQVSAWVRSNVNAALELRDYQIEVWQRLWEQRTCNVQRRALVSLATGLGKTSVAAVDVLHYLREEKPGGKVLFVSHMTDISAQANQTFTAVGSDLNTALFRRTHTAELGEHDVVFATFQALYRCLDELDPQQFDYIIWDEAHHIEADTFSEVRGFFQPCFELGLTATPERADGLNIFAYFGQPLFVKTLAEGMAEGWLSAVDYHIMLDETVREAMNKKFDFQTTKQIRELFSVRARNEVIAKNVMERRHAIGLEKAKTIVFCQNVEMAEGMATLLGGEAYHSNIDREARFDILKRFRAGDLQVITTVDMFNEGIDIPDARLIVFLRSTSSRTVFEQQLGRGLRRSANKSTVTVLDFVANVERIDFVRELGHTVKSIQGERGISAGGTARNESHGPTAIEHAHFSLNNFEFEDQTIEILERYNAIKSTPHLTQDIVVAAYQELRSVSEVAKKYSVSTTAIYKHLRKAGISTRAADDNYDIEEIARIYYELKSAKKAGAHFGVNGSTIIDRLRRAGYQTIPHPKARFTDDEIVRAFEASGYNHRETARRLSADRAMIMRRLKSLGYESKWGKSPVISKEALDNIYRETGGDIAQLTATLQGALGCRYTDIYKALDTYGYLDDHPRPVTSAIAAAAYYKFGNSTQAGKHLGISATLVSRKAQVGRYIRKYKQAKAHTALEQAA